MSHASAINALQEYKKVGLHSELEHASPYRLIQMLMDGAMDRMSKAKINMLEKNIKEKGEFISMSISIIGGLRDSLDHEAGGDIAKNLDSLYEYMSRRLMQANINDDTTMLDEVMNLMMQIKSAWDTIEPYSNQPENVNNLQAKAG